jgi:hypothetical protein
MLRNQYVVVLVVVIGVVNSNKKGYSVSHPTCPTKTKSLLTTKEQKQIKNNNIQQH